VDRRLAIAAVAILGAVLALIVALRSDDPPAGGGAARPRPTAAKPGAATRPGAAASGATFADRGSAPILAPEKPAALDTTGVDDEPLWTAFDQEPRDPGWALDKEQAIRARLRPLLDGANHGHPGTVAVPHVECREDSCRMLITGTDQRAFQSFVESLQDERGFYGDAKLLALDGYGSTVDKDTGRERQQVRVHLQYER